MSNTTNILEEFWYGNLEPSEYDANSSKEYKEILQLISRNEDKLLATMTDEQGRMSFKLSAPYSEDRRKRASNLAKQNTNRLRNQKP